MHNQIINEIQIEDKYKHASIERLNGTGGRIYCVRGIEDIITEGRLDEINKHIMWHKERG
jgi:hypothetical protein